MRKYRFLIVLLASIVIISAIPFASAGDVCAAGSQSGYSLVYQSSRNDDNGHKNAFGGMIFARGDKVLLTINGNTTEYYANYESDGLHWQPQLPSETSLSIETDANIDSLNVGETFPYKVCYKGYNENGQSAVLAENEYTAVKQREMRFQGGYTYATMGPDNVLLEGAPTTGNITIPSTVTSQNHTYTVSRIYGINSRNITSITVPPTVTKIDDLALGYYPDDDLMPFPVNNINNKVEGFTIYGKKNTEAYRYAVANGFTFRDADTGEIVTPDSSNTDNTETDNKASTIAVKTGEVNKASTIAVKTGKVKVISTVSHTAAFSKAAPQLKSVTVPDSVSINGEAYTVTTVDTKAFEGSRATSVTIGKNIKTIKKKAFASSKVKTVTVKTTALTKKAVKGSLKGSKVKTIKVKVGNKKKNKKYIRKYKKVFTKKNAGRKVTVK